MADYPTIASLYRSNGLLARLQELNIDLPLTDPMPVPNELALAQSYCTDSVQIGNRWCIHPMEGWDGTVDGRPSELTVRRWQRFGASGAKLIWGGEAVAIRPDGRANPNQLCLNKNTVGALAQLREALEAEHKRSCGSTKGLLVGLQLTHSGRYCRPNKKDQLEPRIAFHHPVLDNRCGIAPDDNKALLSDGELEQLIADYVQAAALAQEAGFAFVDVKHCHGYLLHEFLSARTRPGAYGGDFAGRTRLAREIIAGIRRECPALLIGVRLSAFDLLPFRPDPVTSAPGRPGRGVAEQYTLPHLYAFGMSEEDPLQMDLSEPIAFIRMLRDLGVFMVNCTAGSPYYNPHIQRPALFPPSDGYQPPEDPLVGVARQMAAVREIKAAVPDMPVVGSAYTYLQENLPQVAEAAVRDGWTDFVGIGRMVLAYPTLPLDVLAGRELVKQSICRTFSDCTTAPRKGLVSGCFPLDTFYRQRPEAQQLKAKKREG